MKEYNVYQHLPGDPTNERYELEKNSKFWDVGKWNYFVLPLLPKLCKELTYIEGGCNAGLYLGLAKELGYKRVIGVESDKGAWERGIKYRDDHDLDYNIILDDLTKATNFLPLADVTVLVNVHYHLRIIDWLEYLDKLQYKTRYCLIVTVKTTYKSWRALSSIEALREYFKDWEETGYIPWINPEGDPSPREMSSIIFKSKHLDRVPIKSIGNSDSTMDFYTSHSPMKSEYANFLRKYRSKKWSEKEADNFLLSKLDLYNNVKLKGLKSPLVVRTDNRLIDGCHRAGILKALGYETAIIRKTV